MSSARAVIVEDNEIQCQDLAIQLLKAGYQVAGMAASAEEALTIILENKPDFILVDVELRGSKDGISLVHELGNRDGRIWPIIYLTKFTDESTAKRARLTTPVAYLHKPYNLMQLMISIETAIRLASLHQNQQNKLNEAPYLLNDSVFIKSENTLFRIPVQDIYLVEAQRQYSFIYTPDKTYLQSHNLENVSQKLDHPDIVRVHRSFLINVGHIERITGKLIQMKRPAGMELPKAVQQLHGKVPIGDKYKQGLMERLRAL